VTARMRVVCCLCGRQYATKPCEPKMDGQVSHGVCPECEPALRKRMGLDEEGKVSC
jgi:hypothetical protein